MKDKQKISAEDKDAALAWSGEAVVKLSLSPQGNREELQLTPVWAFYWCCIPSAIN